MVAPFGVAAIACGPGPTGIGGPAVRVVRLTGLTELEASLATQAMGWRVLAAAARNLAVDVLGALGAAGSGWAEVRPAGVVEPTVRSGERVWLVLNMLLKA